MSLLVIGTVAFDEVETPSPLQAELLEEPLPMYPWLPRTF